MAASWNADIERLMIGRISAENQFEDAICLVYTEFLVCYKSLRWHIPMLSSYCELYDVVIMEVGCFHAWHVRFFFLGLYVMLP